MRLKKEISDTRYELNKLIEIREALSAVILEVSQRLDLLIDEYMKATDKEG